MKKKMTVLLIAIGLLLTALSFFIRPWITGAGGPAESSDIAGIFVLISGIVLLAVGLFLLLFPFEKLRRRNLLPKGASYEKRKSIMTKPELEFYGILVKILDERRYAVIPQSALGTAIEKRSGGGYYSELFRIADYLIVSKHDYRPLLFVELNDASHLKADRRERDDKVLAICEDAGMPLVTVDFSERNDANIIKNKIKKYL